MLTVTTTFAIFTMLGLSSLAIFWAKRFHIPHTVFLVFIGVCLSGLSLLPVFSVFNDFYLTPELLFYLFLPTLIFESAYNISSRRLVEDAPIVLLLAVVSLLTSTLLIAGALQLLFMLLSVSVPLIFTVLFGALISATDPVAVLALFKEFGAPRRLSLIFEGESLFNDATAVALFLVILGVIIEGYHGIDTWFAGTASFFAMLIGGVVFGAIMGGLFVKLVGWTRQSETASITLTIVLAHLTFILTDIISEHFQIGSFAFHMSPIISTTVASLIMGNYGRAKIHPRAEEFIEKIWGQLAFMANSLIFILIGLLATTIPLHKTIVIEMIIGTIIVVAAARALSIYPVVRFFNALTKSDRRLPRSWQHLLSWGSLRGALAVTMVLLVPPSLTIPNWSLAMSPQELLLSLTVGCIFTTLFVKATTIGWFMRKLRLDQFTDMEQIEYHEAHALMHQEVTDRLNKYEERGYIDSSIAKRLRSHHSSAFLESCATIASLSSEAKDNLAARVLRLYAIGIERRYLRELYHYEEVDEGVFRRLTGKLQLQFEAIEHGELSPNTSIHTDGKDIFERMVAWMKSHFQPPTPADRQRHLFMYYRAQTILARKVRKELAHLTPDTAANIFTLNAVEHVDELYAHYQDQSSKKMQELLHDAPDVVHSLSEELAARGMAKVEEQVLHEVTERGLVTPKLHVTLEQEIREARL